MSEPTPPPVAGGTVDGTAHPLTPDAIEAVLVDFRAWLQAAATSPSANGTGPVEPPDLHTLLGQFTALRHEVNLQTKAVRAQQEQNAETLRQLSQAVVALQQQKPSDSADEELRPLLKTLIDLYDALALAAREIERVQRAMPATTEQSPVPEIALALPFWTRWLGLESKLKQTLAQRQPAPAQPTEQVRQLLDSVLSGYRMSLQRVERALQQHELEAIPAAGRPFDPEHMEVMEAVSDSGRAAGEVIDEVRRGYLWRGQVFRYAQVRVAK